MGFQGWHWRLARQCFELFAAGDEISGASIAECRVPCPLVSVRPSGNSLWSAAPEWGRNSACHRCQPVVVDSLCGAQSPRSGATLLNSCMTTTSDKVCRPASGAQARSHGIVFHRLTPVARGVAPPSGVPNANAPNASNFSAFSALKLPDGLSGFGGHAHRSGKHAHTERVYPSGAARERNAWRRPRFGTRFSRVIRTQSPAAR